MRLKNLQVFAGLIQGRILPRDQTGDDFLVLEHNLQSRQAFRRCLEIFEQTGRAWKPERERVEMARQRLQALGVGMMARRDGEIGFDP